MLYRRLLVLVRLFFGKIRVTAARAIKGPAVFGCNHRVGSRTRFV